LFTPGTPQNSPMRTVQSKPTKSEFQNVSLMSSSNSINNGVSPTSRTRRLSNSSLASDVSFRLPSYDSPAVYHLQSDAEYSASEAEDSNSIAASAQLESISKEQIYAAYRRSTERYQKYRGRYNELARKYKELERDNTKARVL
jgi:hypothetical protein